jgi:hypothetical protein
MSTLLKSVGAASCVALFNVALVWAGLGHMVLAHAWGLACWIVFMDAVQIQHELKLAHEKLNCIMDKYALLQEAYHREVSATDLKHIEFVKSFSSHTSSITEKIDGLDDKMTSYIHSVETSPQTDSSDSNEPVPLITPLKMKEILNKQRSLHLKGQSIRICVSSSPRCNSQTKKSLTGSGSCQF